MSIDFIRPEVDELRPRISVIGVGGAGGNVLMAATVVALMLARSPLETGLCLVVFGAASATGGVNLYAIAQMFAGPRAAGSFIGIQNGVGNVPGIVMPIITGLIIDWTGLYDNAFLLTAAVCILSALWWVVGVPKIEQVRLD